MSHYYATVLLQIRIIFLPFLSSHLHSFNIVNRVAAFLVTLLLTVQTTVLILAEYVNNSSVNDAVL